MINMFKVRKFAALIISGFMTSVFFWIGAMLFNIWIGLILLFVGLLISVFIGVILLKNPFTEMVEGKGILTLNIDSTGIIKPFVVGVQSPYITGKLNNQTPVKDIFDREAVYQLAPPVQNETKAELSKEGININLDEKEYNKARFALFHYPVLIWNDQIKSILTKDFFSKEEKSIFSRHGLLYLNRKMEELTSAVRDFGRYVVELTKPGLNMKGSTIAMIIVVIVLIILGALFLPKIIASISNASGGLGKSFSAAGNAGATIIPRG